MKIAIVSLAMLLPLGAGAATAEPKDKYINCNCHITPNVSGEAPVAVVHRKVRHHRPKTPAAPPLLKSDAIPDAPKLPESTSAENDTVIVPRLPGRESVITTNKLALPPGKAVYAPGELVYISGRVLDKHCVPVSDAIVEISQADPEGRYVKASLAQRLSPEPTFTGMGRATTDNLGRFNFVTVYPGVVGGRAPFIHVHVAHKLFPALNTEMFFSDEQRNAGDSVYASLPSGERDRVTAKVWQRDVSDPAKGLAATWDISLDGSNPYRHF